MTTIRFETCVRNRALTFLKGHYPKRIVEDTENSAAAVLDLVEGDVFRIPDPSLHGGTIYPSKNWPDKKGNQEAAIAVLQAFHDATILTAAQGSNAS